MDTLSRASFRRTLILFAVLIILCVRSNAQSVAPDTPDALQNLVKAKRWNEAVSLCAGLENRTAAEEYSCGLAYASANRLEDARHAFLHGHEQKKSDPRFLTELGGVEFMEKNYDKAARALLKARRLSPNDLYVNDFLGTVFFLNGNLEASLKYWNRAQKPNIADVRLQPMPRVDPVLLDRAVSISPGSVLTAEQLLSTRARVDALEVLPRASIQLKAKPDGTFDVSINAAERHGFGTNKWDALLSTFGSIFYQTITPEYYNIGNSSATIKSSWRWDAEKRRATASLSAPLHRKASWRYSVGLDLRNENWSVANFSGAPLSFLGALNMRRSAGTLEVESIANGRWSWRTGAEMSYRDFRNVTPESPLQATLLSDAYELKHTFSTDYSFLRIPERHYFADVSARSQIGRFWSADSGGSSSFAKLEARVKQDWSSSTNGKYEVSHQVRGGKTFGSVPFDELYNLGIERDNDLLMRAHIGTADGRKGSAPLGRNYFVSNLDADKRLWSNGLIAVRLGPFLDTGRITDPLSYLGTQKWLVDTGGQLKVRVLGVGVGVTYGRDLRSGKGAWYTSLLK